MRRRQVLVDRYQSWGLAANGDCPQLDRRAPEYIAARVHQGVPPIMWILLSGARVLYASHPEHSAVECEQASLERTRADVDSEDCLHYTSSYLRNSGTA